MNNNGTNVVANSSITLSGPVGVTFYTGGGCTGATTGINVTASTSTQNFYFISASADSVIITATDASGAGLADNPQTRIRPSKLAFDGIPNPRLRCLLKYRDGAIAGCQYLGQHGKSDTTVALSAPPEPPSTRLGGGGVIDNYDCGEHRFCEFLLQIGSR